MPYYFMINLENVEALREQAVEQQADDNQKLVLTCGLINYLYID